MLNGKKRLMRSLMRLKKKITSKYRIDKQSKLIYENNEYDGSYYFLCTYNQIGATAQDRQKTIIKLIEEWKENCEYPIFSPKWKIEE